MQARLGRRKRIKRRALTVRSRLTEYALVTDHQFFAGLPGAGTLRRALETSTNQQLARRFGPLLRRIDRALHRSSLAITADPQRTRS